MSEQLTQEGSNPHSHAIPGWSHATPFANQFSVPHTLQSRGQEPPYEDHTTVSPEWNAHVCCWFTRRY